MSPTSIGLLVLAIAFVIQALLLLAILRLSRERDRQDVEAIRHAQAQTGATQ